MSYKPLPPRYLNILLVLELGIHFILPIARIIHSPYRYLGIIIILLGLSLNVWATSQLRQVTAIGYFRIPTRLEMSGVFRISRNPIYLSGVIVSSGIAILLGSLITFIFPIVLAIILNCVYIPFEETKLEEIFGKEYKNYKEKVRRWI